MIPTLRIKKIDQGEHHGQIMDDRELLGEVSNK
jgi:hypothetical protein